MDWGKKYQELKERVEGITSTDEEKKRIKKEEELFASRGWEEYMALTHTILSRLDAFPLLSATAGGTVFNSLFLNKAGRKDADRFRTEGYENLEKGPLVLSFKAQGTTGYYSDIFSLFPLSLLEERNNNGESPLDYLTEKKADD